MVKITEDKLGTMAEYAEKMLHYGGKLMACLDEMQGGYSQRGGFGMREEFGGRGGMNYRYPEEMGMRDYNERDEYAERRGRDARGRYTRM